jgi:hypothetical protein
LSVNDKQCFHLNLNFRYVGKLKQFSGLFSQNVILKLC